MATNQHQENGISSNTTNEQERLKKSNKEQGVEKTYAALSRAPDEQESQEMSNKDQGGVEKTYATLPRIPFPSCRLVFCLLSFFGFFVTYCLRVNLSVAIVAMVNTTHAKEFDDANGANFSATAATEQEELCESQDINDTHTDNDAKSGSYYWNANEQGIILAAFFYGYIITQIPGGSLAQKFGGKLPFLFGIFWTSLLTLLTPVLTYAGEFVALVVTRILEGIGEGVTFPAMHAMLSKWAPPTERGKMVTIIYAGSHVGTVLTMPISGLLCQYVSWESVFYVSGVIGVVWSVLWFFLIFDAPRKHPRISSAERDYIESSQGPSNQTKGSLKVPWLEILKSPPVYAVAVGHFTNNWGFYTMLTCLPQYLNHIFKFDIKSNGAISGLPYLALWGIMVLAGACTDMVSKRKLLSTINIRRIANIIGFIGPAICLVITGHINCNTTLAVFFIVLGVGLSGASWAGWGVNHLDLAPPYSGTLMGITNTVATITGFVAPSVVGALTNQNQTRAAWRGVFYIAAGVYIFGTIFFLIFGSADRQKWSIEPSEDKTGDGKERKDVEDSPLVGHGGAEKEATMMKELENGQTQDTESPKTLEK